jgi:glyoxylase-like metal-dependent hydrolase (beta-lactamase superfamily II)
MGDLGAFFVQCFNPFKFEGINPLPATETFEGRMDLTVGSKEVQLIEVGPAHTRGDMIVYVPGDRVVFAGDILFIGGTPIMWAGPVDNWIKACDLMLDMDVDVIVPGHGPITDKQGVESMRGFWEFMKTETRKRYDAGMSSNDAVNDIDLGEYATWGESERVVVNVNRLYAEFSGDTTPANILELFGTMATLGLKK